ncbi:MAG: rod shape-determining protein MreD [Acidobacteriaceae bacterium]|nr:rod shape-determining protein MreD [Acidobacteriaceae bacterium]
MKVKTLSMPSFSYTSRRELAESRFPLWVTVLVPIAAILLQALISGHSLRLAIVDLPLLVVIFFAISRRSPIAGTITGMIVGLLQDALTAQPVGVNGMAKSVVGYMAASIGLKIDVESVTTRVVISFGFSLVSSGLLYMVNRWLLGAHDFQPWPHELLRALLNTAIAVPLFLLLDRTKRKED